MSIKIPPRLVQLMPLPMDDHKMLAHRHGGNRELPVIENQPGVYTSAWMINNDAKAFLKSRKGLAVITLVVDINVPGHPTVSMKMQPVELRPDGPGDPGWPTKPEFPTKPEVK